MALQLDHLTLELIHPYLKEEEDYGSHYEADVAPEVEGADHHIDPSFLVSVGKEVKKFGDKFYEFRKKDVETMRKKLKEAEKAKSDKERTVIYKQVADIATRAISDTWGAQTNPVHMYGALVMAINGASQAIGNGFSRYWLSEKKIDGNVLQAVIEKNNN